MPPGALPGLSTYMSLVGLGAGPQGATPMPPFTPPSGSQAPGGVQPPQQSQQPQGVDIAGAFRVGEQAAQQDGGGFARGGQVRGYAGGGGVSDGGLGSISPMFIEMTRRQMATMARGGRVGYADGGMVDDGSDDPDSESAVLALLQARQPMEGGDAPLTGEDRGLALAQAGFAAAAGQSPHALQNFGAGALSGVQALQKMKQARAVQRMRETQLQQQTALRQAALMDAARQRAAALEQRKTEAQARADQAAAALEAKKQSDKDRADAAADRASANAAQNATLNAIKQEQADAAKVRAEAAAAAAPTGVTPPSLDQALASGVPFSGVKSPYVNVSAKAQEDLYKSNEKIFESAQEKNKEAQGARQVYKADLDRMSEINEKDVTGPSNELPVYGWARKAMDEDRQEFNSLVNKHAPDQRAMLPGAASDADVVMFKDAGATLGKKKEANRNIIQAKKAALQNSDDYDQYRRDFFSVHHHLNDADKKWKEYLTANPVFKHGKDVPAYTFNEDRLSYADWFRMQEQGGPAPAPKTDKPFTVQDALKLYGTQPKP